MFEPIINQLKSICDNCGRPGTTHADHKIAQEMINYYNQSKTSNTVAEFAKRLFGDAELASVRFTESEAAALCAMIQGRATKPDA